MTAEEILAICAVATVLGGIFLWVTRSTLAPFKILIAANNDIMTSLKELVANHTDRLDDHGQRITKIETKHSVRHPGED